MPRRISLKLKSTPRMCKPDTEAARKRNAVIPHCHGIYRVTVSDAALARSSDSPCELRPTPSCPCLLKKRDGSIDQRRRVHQSMLYTRQSCLIGYHGKNARRVTKDTPPLHDVLEPSLGLHESLFQIRRGIKLIQPEVK